MRTIENVRLVNWTDPENPRMHREICDSPTLLSFEETWTY